MRGTWKVHFVHNANSSGDSIKWKTWQAGVGWEVGGLQSASVWGIMLQTQPMFYPRCDATLIALAIVCLVHSLYVPESGTDLVHCNVLGPVGL